MAPAIQTVLAALLILLNPSRLYAQTAYHQPTQASGTIHSWGSAQMSELMRLWERDFRRDHPTVVFQDKLNGTVSGMAGLYSGAADLALMGREIWPAETMAFEQVTGHSPAGIKVAIGSFDVPTKADALAVFVHRDNPVSKLTLAQLKTIFGCGDATATVSRWGDLGITGALAERPILTYGYKLDNAAAIFFKTVVLKSMEWRCGIHTFANSTDPNGKRIDSGQLIIDALSRDPAGIAISNSHYATGEVKPVALSLAADSGAVLPTRESIANGSYPLARAVYIFFNRNPEKPPEPRLREFLRFVLSAEGQQDVAHEGAYLPLPESERLEQLNALTVALR
jgi:phosphate transport system substrate-binding protein